ncbi:hypothetical protein CCP3SC1AL1_1590004 [Gammaproteobacteria bacterium]
MALSALLYVPQKIYEMLTDSLITLFNAIFTACTFCDFNLNSNLAALPVGVLFILSWFKIDLFNNFFRFLSGSFFNS